MSNSYAVIHSMVERGELEITYILSPMRTLSTVLGAALEQFADGYQSEPMWHANDFHTLAEQDFSDGCEEILQVINRAKAAKVENGVPLRIILKDMSHIVTPDAFEKLLPITQNVILNVRDPYLQASSAIKALEKDGVSSQDAEDIYIDCNREAYNNLGLILEKTEQHLLDNPDKKCVILGSAAARHNPVQTLVSIAKEFGWDSSVAKNEWSASPDSFLGKKQQESLSLEEKEVLVKSNHWIKNAASSTHIKPLELEATPRGVSRSLSSKVNKFIDECAMPIYNDLISSSRSLVSYSDKAMLSPHRMGNSVR